MVGNFLNGPRATPRGHGAVIDAINLLASFGGGSDDLLKMLEDTRAAIAQNQLLISDAQNIVEQAKAISRREDAVAAREAKVEKKWQMLEEIRADLKTMSL